MGVGDGVAVVVGDGVAMSVGDGVMVRVGNSVAVGVRVLTGAGVGESLSLAKDVSAGRTVPPDGEPSLHTNSRTADIKHSNQTPTAP